MTTRVEEHKPMHMCGDMFERMIGVDQFVPRMLPHKDAYGESNKYANLELAQMIFDKCEDKIHEWMIHG